ncbi:uncharacterized protein EHS24_005106 [Apiotrichum porosum]|uniref:Uncharacterized protein n=1 Tax=Apiotrichum porosum TaxID=105984 RepID=A0A427Y6W4_9TREE|nr:uncharacterized protein EHS24_005106 [Apiotrichum porosum]RSH86831.1 hypothetical protein EHS24_005106 [Apiotrichum porosum]
MSSLPLQRSKTAGGAKQPASTSFSTKPPGESDTHMQPEADTLKTVVLTSTDNVTLSSAITIDHAAFPHLIDTILQHPVSWAAMRRTCKKYNTQVTGLMYRHLRVSAYPVDTATYDYGLNHYIDSPVELLVTSPYAQRLPFFRKRRLDDMPNGSSQSPSLEPCGGRLKHTEVLDIPFGVSKEDLTWFRNTLKNLKVVRFYTDPDLFERAGGLGSLLMFREHVPTVIILPQYPDSQDGTWSYFTILLALDFNRIGNAYASPPYITIVDFPIFPAPPSSKFRTFKDEFMLQLAYELARHETDQSGVTSFCDNISFVTPDQYKSTLSTRQFELEYRL